MRRHLLSGVFALLILLSAAWAAPVRFTVLFFNDLHGQLQPLQVKGTNGETVETGGIARIATLVRTIRQENEAKGQKTFLLVAGDILQGTPMSTVFRGRPDVEALNALGVSAMTIGNHEFDFGLKNFLELRRLARFPFLSANVIWKGTWKTLSDPYASFPLADNIVLTVIGATTRELTSTTAAENVARVGVLDAAPLVSAHFRHFRLQGPVLLLSHSRFQTDEAIARSVPGLAAIVGGHDQILFNPYRQVLSVPVFQAFEKGKYLGRLELAYHPESGRTAIVSWGYTPVAASIKPDAQVAAIVAGYAARLDAQFREVIGENRRFLYGERDKIRYEETNLGDFVADVMRAASRTDIALINAGALRASIDEGPITMEEVFKMMPYANDILQMNISGDVLLQVLTRAVRSKRDEEDGGFLHVSGIRLRIDGQKVRDVTVSGQPLLGNRIYTLAVSDFMANGGDGYTMLTGLPRQATGLPLRELLVNAIRLRRIIDVVGDGRIVRSGE